MGTIESVGSIKARMEALETEMVELEEDILIAEYEYITKRF